MKKVLIIIAGILFLLPGCSSAEKLSPEDQYKKSFGRFPYESFSKTSVPGVYEVYDGRQVYYYLPDGDVIMVGPMISKEGKNLSEESTAKKMASKMNNLPLDQALKIGNGKIKVVEFIDPNCHYCKLSFNFFNARKKDVTMYVFFHPLSDDSRNKIRHILCSKNREQAYDDVLGGKPVATLNSCTDKDVETIIQNHQQVSQKVGVRATPLFYIKGQAIPGFDQPAIEKLLAE